MEHKVKEILKEAAMVHQKMYESNRFEESVITLAKSCIKAIRNGNKIMFSGNGGSAADAQHLAAELVNRFSFDRPAIAALALTTDTSVITSVGNDSAFGNIFSRQIEAIGKKGDVLIALSTSGTSPNIISAIETATNLGITVAGFSGDSDNKMTRLCDITVKIPSRNTPRIQEGHILAGHILCLLIEAELYA